MSKREYFTMDKSIKYADILTRVLRQTSAVQPRLQNLKISSVCDRDTGHFLIIMTGWQKESWRDQILFHARLIDDKIVIEDDNFEEGLTNILIQEGIDDKDIVTQIEKNKDILSMPVWFVRRAYWKSHFKKAILFLQARIDEHHEKIKLELKKDYPDERLIKHWQREIKTFEKGIEQALKRLGKK